MTPPQTTPIEITPNIQEFLNRFICAPVWMDVRPEPYAVPNECFLNVAKKIARDGGFLQHGWVVWYAPGVILEAEFHGVWISPTGEMVDITPHDGESRILFVPDHQRKWKGMGHVVPAMIAEANGRTLPTTVQIVHAYARPNVGRNNPCPCGSGAKYKKCCGGA